MNRKKAIFRAVGALAALAVVLAVLHKPLTQFLVRYQAKTQREAAQGQAGMLVAHRGAGGIFPENSLPAFEMAGIKGYETAECDISFTKDGRWVVMHDLTVNRTTNGKGYITSMTFDEIAGLSLRVGGNLRHMSNLRVPSLEDFLAICYTYSMTPFIELKAAGGDDSFENLLAVLRTYAMEDKAVILSFDPEKLAAIREKSAVRLMLLTNRPGKKTIDAAVTLTGCDVGMDYTKITNALLAYARQNSVLVNAYTVDDRFIYEDLSEKGVNYITTNTIAPPPRDELSSSISESETP